MNIENASNTVELETPATARKDTFGKMSLEQAIERLLPIIAAMDRPGMRAIEAATGLKERTARFHVGQLVKHAHLVRHGFGRSACYSAATVVTCN